MSENSGKSCSQIACFSRDSLKTLSKPNNVLLLLPKTNQTTTESVNHFLNTWKYYDR